jgi:hypothetical protein
MTLALPHVGPTEAALCRILASTLSHSKVGAPDNRKIDWNRFVRLVERHRVAPVVWKAREQLEVLEPPEHVLRAVRASHGRNGLRALQATALLVRTVHALSDKSIRGLPLKGITLAARSYGDLTARHCGDIDLLVSRRRLAEADTVLRSIGWIRVSNKTRLVVDSGPAENPALAHHFTYAYPGGVTLELHYMLHPNAELMPIDVDAVVAQGDTVEIGGQALPVLPDNLQMLFLCTHGARHNWKRLQWIVDIAVLLDRAAPETQRTWMEEARRRRLFNPVMQGIVLAELTLAGPRPEGAPKGETSFLVRSMIRHAAPMLFRSLDEEPDELAAGLDPGIRFYRLCMSGSPAYHWQEVWRGMQSFSAQIADVPSRIRQRLKGAR